MPCSRTALLAHHEEGRVDNSSGRGDDLAPTPVQGLLGNDCIQDLKLDISNHWKGEGGADR